MKFRSIWLLAKAVVVESVRRKDLWVVAILGALFIASSRAIGLLGAGGVEVFLRDLSVSVLGLFSAVLTVLTSVRLIPEELKQKTLYPLLSRPVTRLDFILGKWVGAVLVSWIGFLILTAFTALSLLAFGVHFEPIVLQYVFLKLIGLSMLCAITLTLSLFLTPQAAATLSFLIAFGAGMISRSLALGFPQMGAGGKLFAQALNVAIPQYSLFDIGSRVAYLHWPPVEAWVVGFLIAYAAVYSAIFLFAGHSKFERQTL